MHSDTQTQTTETCQQRQGEVADREAWKLGHRRRRGNNLPRQLITARSHELRCCETVCLLCLMRTIEGQSRSKHSMQLPGSTQTATGVLRLRHSCWS